LIADDGFVKVVDFGLAKLSGGTMLTKEGTTMGTVAYMSPEPEPWGKKIDHLTDIWIEHLSSSAARCVAPKAWSK